MATADTYPSWNKKSYLQQTEVVAIMSVPAKVETRVCMLGSGLENTDCWALVAVRPKTAGLPPGCRLASYRLQLV